MRDDEEDDDDRPRRKKRRRDDDDEDDDDDRPRRRTRGRKAKSQTGLIVGMAVGGGVFLLALGVGVTAYLMLRQPQDTAKPTTKPTTLFGGGSVPPVVILPPGSVAAWVSFRQPDGLYSCSLPPTPLLPPFTELKPFGGDKLSTLATMGDGLACMIEVKVLSQDSLTRHLEGEKATTATASGGGGPTIRQINWLGRAVREEENANGHRVTRTFRDNTRLYKFEVSGFNRKVTDDEKAKFFNSVVLDPR